MRRCWECRNIGHYKRDCKLKGVKTNKGSEEIQSIEIKVIQEEKGDVYLASMSTQLEQDVWLIDPGASFHMEPYKDWFYEYEELDGGDVLLGDDSLTKIIR